MRLTLEDFLNWQEKNMYKYDNKNIVLTYYINVHKGNIYNRRVIECGYCKKIFVQKIRMENQKYCSRMYLIFILFPMAIFYAAIVMLGVILEHLYDMSVIKFKK